MPPKKTSKTAHVLNLIAGVEESDNPVLAATEENTEETPESEDRISLDIRGIASRTKSDMENDVNKAVIESIKEEIIQVNTRKSNATAGDSPPDTSGARANNTAFEKESKVDTMDETNKTAFNQDDFVTVNIVEDIVKSKAHEFAKKFGACECHRCVSDIIALALNELPPRYTVTHKGMLFSKISSYENQHVVDISQALTKACMMVTDRPRHNDI